jgi:signal transduction histidine kinase
MKQSKSVRMPTVKLPTKNRWLWIALFVWAAVLITVLATGWNVVLVSNYLRMLRVAHSVNLEEETVALAPWPIVIAGTLGFVAAMGTVVLFFLRLLREMRLNQKQSEFLATVSHELKTPIASIELTSSLIRNGGLSGQESASLWESQQRELKRLREQVETILEAARWQHAPSRPSLCKIDLESWLDEAIDRWSSVLGNQGEIIRKGVALPKQAWIDPESLSLVIDNIFDNARKFAQGTPRITIKTNRLRAKRSWRIEIQDEGWGFEPSEAKRIMQRFTRGHHHAPYSIPGTGLGLFLAHSACRAMGLKLSAASPGYGKGATFTLEGPDQTSGQSKDHAKDKK